MITAHTLLYDLYLWPNRHLKSRKQWSEESKAALCRQISRPLIDIYIVYEPDPAAETAGYLGGVFMSRVGSADKYFIAIHPLQQSCRVLRAS